MAEVNQEQLQKLTAELEESIKAQILESINQALQNGAQANLPIGNPNPNLLNPLVDTLNQVVGSNGVLSGMMGSLSNTIGSLLGSVGGGTGMTPVQQQKLMNVMKGAVSAQQQAQSKPNQS